MPAIVPCHARPERAARGFSIAELLSAIIVLAVGTLGVVALYVDRVHEQTHNPRSIATALADEMADRIRQHGSTGTSARLQAAPFCTQLPGPATETPTKADTLGQDIACWQDKVSRSLPSGTGMVQREDGVAAYRVLVSWSEAGAGAASVVMRVK
jgi:type IV pilus assembly protein PilV